MHLTTGSAPSAFVSHASGTVQRPARRCTHCNKLGHSVDFCWDIHPEKRLVRGRPPSGRRSPSVSDSSQSTPSSGAKNKLSPYQLKELQAYIGRLSTTPEESSTSDGAQLAQALVASTDEGNPSFGDWIVDSGVTHHMTGDSKLFQEYQLSSGKQRVSMADGVVATVSNEKDSQMERVTDSQMEGVTAAARDHLFGQVYVRKEKATVEDVVDEDRTNPNPAISLNDPSPSTEELPIALRKGTKSWLYNKSS
ncbi:hypothetical protein EJ110_NYTH32470 [Nymphaea thermarum]|nr:hypothetical protein EJ110_NYTH32470 [Nymphaea thermarum]